MKKVLVTWANGMLATDFIKHNADKFEIIACDRTMLDITDLSQVRTVIVSQMPDLVLNCAAYTNVDESEDSGYVACFEINATWVFNLALITAELGIDLMSVVHWGTMDWVNISEKVLLVWEMLIQSSFVRVGSTVDEKHIKTSSILWCDSQRLVPRSR